jgi:hypothetical protein
LAMTMPGHKRQWQFIGGSYVSTVRIRQHTNRG